MSTDALTWFVQADIDSPWRRLHWTLPLALLICAIVFVWFAYSMTRPAVRTPEPRPVDAQLVEIPPPAAPAPPAPPKSTAPPKPAARPKPAPLVRKELPAEKPAQPVPPPPPAAPPATPQPNAPALTESHGAQAIVQPMPVIPDELREEAMSEKATARFHIAADGTATVELIKPTQNPRLNRLLLETLRQWRFSPAMEQGKPVESVETMVIRVQVK
jgi:periplasmic protein TonB